MPGKPTLPAERAEMFRYFLEGHTRAEVAEHFGRDPVTVQSIARDDKWEEREGLAHEKAMDDIGLAYAKERAKNMKALIFMRDAFLKEVSDAMKAGGGTGVPQEKKWDKILSAIERLDKHLGIDQPAAPTVNVQVNQQTVNVSVEDLRKELAELEAMHARAVELEKEPKRAEIEEKPEEEKE